MLAEHAGPVIQRVDVLDAGVLRKVTADQLARALEDQPFGEPQRRGKWLIVPVRKQTVLFHFGMTGSLHWADRGEQRHRHDRVVFEFSEGELRYRDMRKLQGLRLAHEEGDVRQLLADVGPDAAQVSRQQLREMLKDRRRQVKAALTDQSIIAGIGNLLADEILWRARIHPRRLCSALEQKEVTRLDSAKKSVLAQSIKQGCVPPRKSWLTGHRDEKKGECPRCGTALERARIGGRTTTWCPRCQPESAEHR